MNWGRKFIGYAGPVAPGTALLVGLAAALTLGGCGMPGAPLPPTLNLALPISDLAAIRAGDSVSLTWTMPKKNTDKLLLKGNLQVRICRREGATGSCATISNLQLAPEAAGKFNEILPAALTVGVARELSYFVEVRNRNGRSAGLSNPAVVLAGEAPAAITGLQAEVRKQGVVLRWNPGSDEQSPAAIRLHRKLLTRATAKVNAELKGPLSAPPEPVELSLLVDARVAGGHALAKALDKNIRFGETYEYRVQRVARVTVDGQMQELDGPLSAPVQVEARDVFPPAVPAGLAAVAIIGENGTEPAIDLSWQPDTEPDLAGYIVYRREGDGSWQRISPAQLVVGPAFHDPHVQAGRSYIYAVSAVDQGGHESERSGEAQETIPGP
jgi:hypothetical protein